MRSFSLCWMRQCTSCKDCDTEIHCEIPVASAHTSVLRQPSTQTAPFQPGSITDKRITHPAWSCTAPQSAHTSEFRSCPQTRLCDMSCPPPVTRDVQNNRRISTQPRCQKIDDMQGTPYDIRRISCFQLHYEHEQAASFGNQ